MPGIIKERLFTPGPTPLLLEAQLRALTMTLHHRTDAFRALMRETLENLRYYFHTKNDVVVFASSGTGAMEGALSNLLSPGERVLIGTAGLALVIGAIVNYIISPKGNPILLFGGIGLICIAILLDAMAYRGLSRNTKATTKGVVLSLACGIAVGLFYPFVAKALTGPNHLGPYTVFFVFAMGAAVSNFPMNYGLMRRPISGQPLRMKDYFHGRMSLHLWGILGGAIWGIGTVANFAASYVPTIGPATSFSLGEGNTMISAIWGIFVWKEFQGAGSRVKGLLAIMFLFFVLGLSCIALAPVIH